MNVAAIDKLVEIDLPDARVLAFQQALQNARDFDLWVGLACEGSNRVVIIFFGAQGIFDSQFSHDQLDRRAQQRVRSEEMAMTRATSTCATARLPQNYVRLFCRTSSELDDDAFITAQLELVAQLLLVPVEMS